MIEIPVVKVVLNMDSETFSREVFADFQDSYRDVAIAIGDKTVEIVVHTDSTSLPHVLNFVGGLYCDWDIGVESMNISRVRYVEVV